MNLRNIRKNQHQRQDVRIHAEDYGWVGSLRIEGREEVYNFEVFDISPDGIGIFTNESLYPKQVISIDLIASGLGDLLHISSSAEIRWVQNAATSTSRRVGLILLPKGNHGLKELYERLLA